MQLWMIILYILILFSIKPLVKFEALFLLSLVYLFFFFSLFSFLFLFPFSLSFSSILFLLSFLFVCSNYLEPTMISSIQSNYSIVQKTFLSMIICSAYRFFSHLPLPHMNTIMHTFVHLLTHIQAFLHTLTNINLSFSFSFFLILLSKKSSNNFKNRMNFQVSSKETELPPFTRRQFIRLHVRNLLKIIYHEMSTLKFRFFLN